MRLIDADKILNVLYEEKKREDCFGMWYTTVCSIIRLLESAPEIKIAGVSDNTDPQQTDCAWK